MEANDKEYYVRTNCSIKNPKTREQCKHDERLMRALTADEELLTFLYNIVNPVVRYMRREARKRAKTDSLPN